MGITRHAIRQAYTNRKYLFFIAVAMTPMMERKKVMPPRLVIVKGKMESQGERKLNLTMW